ncbi:MAG: tyrosine-type recombinase/integrase [Eubacterium sp.]|nr:tyrosine-type recombinase/integrase [Eubacterium sp.]
MFLRSDNDIISLDIRSGLFKGGLISIGKDLKGKELGKGLRQAKNGKYQARVRSGRERLAKTFNKLTEAKAWLLDFSYEKEHYGVLVNPDMTVDEWFEYWMNEIKGNTLKFNTLMSYRARFFNRISPIIGSQSVSKVLPINCQQVINYAQSQGDVTGSVAKVKSIMGALFESAVENKMIHANPVTKNVKYLREETPERTIMTFDEQCQFMEVGQDYAHYDVFVFILNTGLRCGEMSALRWKDIDWEAREIHINGTMFYNAEKKAFEVNSPKTKSSIRTIPLTDDAYEVLKRRKMQRAEKPVSMEYHEFVFVGSEGKPLINYVYNKCLARIAKKIGVEKLTMHSLRHTFATRCIEDGMKPKVLQKILGHKNLAQTMDLYVHVTDDEKASEIKKLQLPTMKKMA